jgi:polar amino acid transport system permease protein
MLLVFVVYILLVGVLVAGMNSWEQKMRIPGYGT